MAMLVVGNVYALPPCPPNVFHNCSGTQTLANGSQYVGEYKDGKFHGEGTYTFADGRKHVGEFKDGVIHGQGTYTLADGGQYVGEFKDNKFHGQGTYTWADGTKYVGDYKDNKRHGQGAITTAKGNKYVGEWKDGKLHGQGTYTFANGNKYVGEYKDGKMHGQGTLSYHVDVFVGVTNGSFLAGEFIDNGPLNGGLYSPSGKLITKYKNREAIYVPPLFAPQYEPGAFSEIPIPLEISKEQERHYLEVLHSPEVEEIRRYLDACLAGKITNPDDLFPCNAKMPDGNLMYVPFNHRKAGEVHWTIPNHETTPGRTINEYRTDKLAETKWNDIFPDREHPISAIDGSFIVLDFQTSAEWKKKNLHYYDDGTYLALNLSTDWFRWDEYPEFIVDPAIPSDNENGSVVTIQFPKPPHDIIVVRLSRGDNGKPRVESFSKPNRPLLLYGGGAGYGGVSDIDKLQERFRLNTVNLVKRYIDNPKFLSCPSNKPCVTPL